MKGTVAFKRFIHSSIYNEKPLLTPPARSPKYISLDLNESYWFLSNKILSQLRKFDVSTIATYPAYEELYTALSKYTGVKEGDLCIFNGSDQAIMLLFELLFRDGDTVIAPVPTFFIYNHALSVCNITAVTPKYKGLTFPLEETLKNLTPKVKGLLLCNPNNPLGNVIPEDSLGELLKKAALLKIPVIIDEAYFEYYGVTAQSYRATYNNLIILRSFSKAFGMAGLRLGYLIADKKLVTELTKLRLPWSVSHFSTFAAIIALRESAFFSSKRNELLEIKTGILKKLHSIGIESPATYTNFLTVYLAFPKKACAYLASKNILVLNLHKKPYNIRGFRFSIPSKKDVQYVIKHIIRSCSI